MKWSRKSLDFGFWIGEFWIWDSGFWIWGGVRQFSDGALRSEARIPTGTVGEREGTWWWKQEEGSKAYIFPCFLGFYVQVWAISVRWSVFGGQSEGNQNQLYLIQLGEERKLGNRNETRREGQRRQPFPQLYQVRLVLVTFRRLQCVFLGCFPPRETCPGRRPQAPACFKSGEGIWCRAYWTAWHAALP